MKTRKLGMNPASRLQTGAAVLAAAQVVEIDLVKPRLAAFASVHRKYAEAQRHVEAADTQLREGQVRLARRDAEQDEAVEGLARALVSGGQPRGNPFAAFGTASPSIVKQMIPGEEAKAIHQLVAAVQRQKASKATLQAAQAAEQAAQRTEVALLAVAKFQETLGNRRRARDDIGQSWEATLAALKRGARAAADDGAPGLYTALFGRPKRSIKKPATPTPTPAPTSTPASTPTPQATNAA